MSASASEQVNCNVNVTAAELCDICVLCADFLNARRLIYYPSTAETRSPQSQRKGVGIHCCGGLSHHQILGAKNS